MDEALEAKLQFVKLDSFCVLLMLRSFLGDSALSNNFLENAIKIAEKIRDACCFRGMCRVDESD